MELAFISILSYPYIHRSDHTILSSPLEMKGCQTIIPGYRVRQYVGTRVLNRIKSITCITIQR
jgi:hypothetical protein